MGGSDAAGRASRAALATRAGAVRLQSQRSRATRATRAGAARHQPQRSLAALLLLAVTTTAAPTWGEWQPPTEAWIERLNYRAEQIKRIASSQERWDGLLNQAVTGLLVPNFTAVGYEVVATPPVVHRKLNESLRAAMAEDRVRTEHHVDQISGPDANFVRLGRLANEVMGDLQAAHEAWSGVALRPSNAYGLRLYRPTNTLTMHTDRLETHVISSIVHVDRDVDEPWPIVIEGYDGVSREVDLQPGQMLFYESAKCIHGRPRPMKGRYYTSLFIHYRPTDWRVTMGDAKAIVEPLFHAPDFVRRPSAAYDDLRLTGTGYYEPDCPHRWCHLAPVWPPVDEDGEDPPGGEL